MDPDLERHLLSIDARLVDISNQLNMLQAVVLELSRRRSAVIGLKASGKAVSECPLSGCEDQCTACQE